MHEIGITPQNYCAENILSGTDVSTPQSMMNCFMNSEPHRAWILSEEVNAVAWLSSKMNMVNSMRFSRSAAFNPN
mgnify:CR=1 FL=1